MLDKAIFHVESSNSTARADILCRAPSCTWFKAGSHRKEYERIKLKTGEDYEIFGQTFSTSFKKQDFQTILERYYLRFIISPCLKPPLKPLVFHSLLCMNRARPTDHRILTATTGVTTRNQGEARVNHVKSEMSPVG